MSDPISSIEEAAEARARGLSIGELRAMSGELDRAEQCQCDPEHHWITRPDGSEQRVDCGCPCDDCRQY